MIIRGGYYIKARKIQESEIAHAPPHVREIWDWLIKEANHENTGKFKRGETIRSLRDIQEGLCWYVGYRKESYSKSKCEMAMKWLRKRGMIKTAKTTRGMIITICNYDIYQDPKCYETNNEKITKPTMKQQLSDTINKKEKKERKKEDIYISSGHLLITWDDFNKLIDEFGEEKSDEYVRKVLNYRKNSKYKSLYLTALNWLRRDKKEAEQKKSQKSKLAI